jgi:hypothetical protein
MAELALAGSVVGVISLGIQVSEGLLRYYHDYTGYGDDVKNLYSKIHGIEATLELLSQALNNRTLASAQISRIVSCLADCKTGLQLLSKRLEKLKKYDDPQGFRETLKAGRSQLLYPFQKDTLKKLDVIVEDLVHRLDSALAVVQLDITLKTHDRQENAHTRLGAIQDSAVRIENVTSELRNLSVSNAAGIKQALASQEAGHFQNSAQYKNISGKLSQIEKATGATQSLLASLPTPGTEKLRAWLSAPDAYTNHHEARSRHEPGTQQWFLDSPDYFAWVRGDERVLSLIGQAGCCKTVLCSTIIEDMMSRTADTEAAFAFFYFTFSDHSKQSYRALLSGVVHQLCHYSEVSSILAKAHKAGRGEVSTAVLESCLISLAGSVPRISLIIDALDEVPNIASAQQDAMENVGRLLQNIPKLYVLTTSRPESGIVDALRQWSAHIMSLKQGSIDQDIEIYVSKEIERNLVLRKLSDELKTMIKTKLGSRADGMWVKHAPLTLQTLLI